MTTLLMLLLGLGLLVSGGTLLVRGASEIAERYGVPPLVVGLTIVGFGTSTPELVVNLVGVSKGATDLAFGNVVGSNISNLALVLGAAAVMMPISIQGQLVRREIPLLLLATTIMTVMALDGILEGQSPAIGRADGITLLLLFFVFIYVKVLDQVRANGIDALFVDIEARRSRGAENENRYAWLQSAAGLVLLYLGGDLTVDNAVVFAAHFAISETVIGLFVVAIGTSMPELVTSVIAAMRRESDLALGNVIGSNLFNSLVVLPASALIRPIPVPEGGVFDLIVSFVLVAALIPVFFIGKAKLSRGAGVLLLVAYLVYAVYRVSGS